MALIRRFELSEMERNSVHDGIDAKYAIFEKDGRSLFKLIALAVILGKFPERKVRPFNSIEIRDCSLSKF